MKKVLSFITLIIVVYCSYGQNTRSLNITPAIMYHPALHNIQHQERLDSFHPVSAADYYKYKRPNIPDIEILKSHLGVFRPDSHLDSLIDSLRKETVEMLSFKYINIGSQSVGIPNMSYSSITDEEKRLARAIYEDVKHFSDSTVKVVISNDNNIYVDIPANTDEEIPPILFLTHVYTKPEVWINGIKPMIHYCYNGGDIALSGGMVLSPNSPQGAHLKNLVGKTIITSDGTKCLGIESKTGCVVLIRMISKIAPVLTLKPIGGIPKHDLFHGRVMIVFSQNESDSKEGLRKIISVFGEKPDILIDVDGSSYDQFTVPNDSDIPDFVPELIMNAAKSVGLDMKPMYLQDTITSEKMIKGCKVYSGKNAVHSCYEWTCLEELILLTDMMTNLVKQVYNTRKRKD